MDSQEYVVALTVSRISRKKSNGRRTLADIRGLGYCGAMKDKGRGELRLVQDERPLSLKCKQGHRVPSEVVKETWVEVPAGEWMAAYRLLPKAGGPVIAEVRVFPAEPGERDAGRWSGDAGRVPEGGLPLTTLRQLRFTEVRAVFSDAIRSFEKEHGRSAVTRVLKRHGLEPKRMTKTRPGRRGHDPAFYAEMAASYVKALRSGSRTPVRDLARELKYSEPQMRDLIHAARTHGMLTSAPPGRPGGELTPTAIELLGGHKKR